MNKTSLKRNWKSWCLSLLFFLLTPVLFAQEIEMDKLSAFHPRNIGPAGMSGRVTAIDVVRYNPNIIYIGTASGGLWKSEDGGVKFDPIFDQEKVLSIGAISIFQNNPDIVWAGTGEGNPRNSLTGGYGIYKSLDGGKNWTCMGLEKTRYIHRVITHPTNPDIVYVAAIGNPWGEHPERGVYKTSDGGKTWNKVLYVNEKTGCADLVMDPNNPQKLVASMWEHRRWPWFFKSGGEGSGLYISWDGGDHWKEITEKDGLPAGELGRIGLAIAPSNSKRIYALVESKKNALYRSDDGGFKWRMINDSDDVANRPFYYCDIFVDPQDEDRVYNIYSYVNKSENGGKEFERFLNWAIHPDHHAWYIHPDDNNFLIDGNDGGLGISRDRGKTWKHITNLPVSQFYHINVDMETPYNVYGGMQDNGSWVGPAYVFMSGGIKNTYWNSLMGGDGFDVVPDSSNSRYCYAMSQGGNVGRIDRKTGYSKMIIPTHPGDVELRFNWNAAIAHDPFDKSTIYYGSQFLHKSSDRGENWEIISEDLTTNNPEKQKQKETGGLTYDDTGAENHTTIISIAPSPAQEGVIWVGTDDGNLQLTKDGGKTWTNLIGKLKGAPECAWIPQIHASNHHAGEAFVVINNYRQADNTAYLYHTTDFGKSWERLADEENIWGYVLSVLQDPVQENLLFLGTEYGLYFSINYGKEWTKWTKDYPNVSTMDMKIHPRENDLVIGTFGRSAWIIDDISPLRELAAEGEELLNKKLHLFNIPDAVSREMLSSPGYYANGHGEYAGENKDFQANISYSVGEILKKKRRPGMSGERPDRAAMMQRMAGMRGNRSMRRPNDTIEPINIAIFDENGKNIRNLTDYPKLGINRTSWNMDQKGFKMPGQSGAFGSRERGGLPALPGTYKVKITYGDAVDSAYIHIDFDPRVEYNLSDIKEKMSYVDDFAKEVEKVNKAFDQLKEAQAAIELVMKQIPKGRSESIRDLRSKSQSIQDTLNHFMHVISPERKKVQGIYSSPEGLSRKIMMAMYRSFGGYEKFSKTQMQSIDKIKTEMKQFVDGVNGIFLEQWPEYVEFIESSDITPFQKK